MSAVRESGANPELKFRRVWEWKNTTWKTQGAIFAVGEVRELRQKGDLRRGFELGPNLSYIDSCREQSFVTPGFRTQRESEGW
jgi:hypothetical protein